MKSVANFEYFGFIGKILNIDLSKRFISEKPIDDSIIKKVLGGAGYACYYLLNLIEKDLDPLSSKNIIIIMTGPLCLTSAPASNRLVICSKSPYTKLWGESNCGGFFGPELKKAGYDGIIIKGKSETPVYIKIYNDDIKIIDASDYWGIGNKKTQYLLKKSFDLKAKVLSIGQAGENLVKYSTINADGRTAGRTGMGAVFGSKNLKAIMVKGNRARVNIKHKLEFNATVKKILSFILKAKSTKVLRELGTSAGVLSTYFMGDLPIKYWSKGSWKKVPKISGEYIKQTQSIKSKSCYGCPIGCGRIVKTSANSELNLECQGPEYETIAGFGSMILNSNFKSILKANNLCNDFGLDTISTSGVIALLYNLYNNKKIYKEDLDDLELEWGNFDSMLKLIEKIAFQKGIGNLLSKGSNYIGDKFNISKDEIATINNLEVPYHDIRACYGMALTYAFSPRGACHTTGDAFKVFSKGNEIDFSSIGIKKTNQYLSDKKTALYVAKLQDYRALYSSLISCFFSNPPPSFIAELINNLMGWDFDLERIKIVGERIFNIKRLFNIKMGLTSENDIIPKILINPLEEGGAKGKSPNFDKLKSNYYKIRNWNHITGKPKLKKLEELELDDFKI